MAYAPVARRASAAVADVVLLSVVGWVVALITGNTDVDVFFCLVGAVVALSSPTRPRIGDRLAHTVVVAGP